MSAGVQQTRLGDFELLAKVGEGGMGAVYKARQISLDRIVALKVLPRRLAQDKQYLDRFVREARAMAKLNHPNIVAGFDVTYADGYHYCVMEFVNGYTLRDWIKKQRRVPQIDVLRVGIAMASALAHAHAAGIIHRDVKPENIIIDADGTPKLTDLGLSKTSEFQDSHLTQTGSVVGTAHYIAPEQAKGDATDGRSDLYSLGCTLYHAATGKTPFDAPTPSVLMLKHITDKLPHPQALNSDLSDEFCTLLSRMVARKPDDRYQTMDEAREDMEALLDSGQLLNPPLPAEAVNFLPGPKATVMLRSSDVYTSARSSTKKSNVLSATGRQRPVQARVRPPRASWMPLAGIGAVVLMVLAYLIYASHGTSEAAEKSGEKTESPEKVAAAAASPASGTDADKRNPQSGTPLMAPAVSPAKAAVTLAPVLPVIRHISAWKVQGPWKLQDGVLSCSAADESAQICRGGALPANFELLFTLNATGGYHFGWSTGREHVANFFDRELDGQIKLTRWTDGGGSVDVATGAFPLSDGKHTFSCAVYENRMKFTVDGRTLLAVTEGTPLTPPQRRFFALYAHAQSSVEFQNLCVRELNSAAEFDAVPAEKR